MSISTNNVNAPSLKKNQGLDPSALHNPAITLDEGFQFCKELFDWVETG